MLNGKELTSESQMHILTGAAQGMNYNFHIRWFI